MSVIYTETVRRYYTEHRPLAMEALGNPQETEDFFRQLGAQIEEQVQQSEDQIAGPSPVGETYLQHVGRLRMARLQAQEIALADLLYSTPPETDDEEEGFSPRSRELMQMTREIHATRAQLIEQLDQEEMDAQRRQHLAPRGPGSTRRTSPRTWAAGRTTWTAPTRAPGTVTTRG